MTYELNNVYNVDSYQAIKNIPDNSIDLVIIDPKWAQIASDRLNNIDATGQISLFTF